MTLNVHLKGGAVVPVAAALGDTPEAVVAHLREQTAGSLTGSAVPFAEVPVELAEGGSVMFGEILSWSVS